MDLVDGLKQLTRMCGKYSSCINCPLRGVGFCVVEKQDRSVDANEKAAAIIEKWAEENPEPVYPSVAKYFEQFGIIIRRDGTLQADFFKAHEPMSADTAQKLGIEPKER